MDKTTERTWEAVDQARAQGAMHYADARFPAMANTAPVLIWEVDEGGSVFVNSYDLTVFGSVSRASAEWAERDSCTRTTWRLT